MISATAKAGDTSHLDVLSSIQMPMRLYWLLQITHRETIAQINELTGAAMTTKGFFYDKGQQVPEGERKLYLVIEGPTELSVKRAKARFGSPCSSVICQARCKGAASAQAAACDEESHRTQHNARQDDLVSDFSLLSRP